jgi:hypothetical protein
MFFTQPDKADLFTRLTPHTAMASLGTVSVVHPPSRQAHPAFHAQFEHWLSEFASFRPHQPEHARAQRALHGRERRPKRRLVRRQPEPLAPARTATRGKPAVVVSAGPSLRKNKHLLKDASERAVIVAGARRRSSRCWRWASSRTSSRRSTTTRSARRFFEKLPPTLRTELVAEPKATSAIFSMYPAPVLAARHDYADKPAPRRLPPGQDKLPERRRRCPPR